MQLQKEASALEGLGALLKLGEEEEDVWPGGVGIGHKAWGGDKMGMRKELWGLNGQHRVSWGV